MTTNSFNRILKKNDRHVVPKSRYGGTVETMEKYKEKVPAEYGTN